MAKKRVHAHVDNVIYANFGATQPPKVDIAPSDETHVRTRGYSRGAQWLIDAVDARGEKKRIQRGLTYARTGHVLTVSIENSVIGAQVAGSQNEPFHTALVFPYRSTDDLAVLATNLAESPNGLLGAHRGALSESVVGILLAESARDVRMRCDCPDPYDCCKHVVAVAYRCAEMFESDPTLIFQLRGINFKDLEEAVSRQIRSTSQRRAGQDSESFWSGTALPPLPPITAQPALEDSNLDLLHKAMRLISYTSVDELRAVSDIEDLYDYLTGDPHDVENARRVSHSNDPNMGAGDDADDANESDVNSDESGG